MLDRLRALVAADPNCVNARGGDGQTPLHVASTVEVAAFLLDHGAAIDALDVDHESTPAQYLIRDHTDVARMLVSRGARTDLLLCAALGDLDGVRQHLEADPARIRMAVNATWFPMRNPQAGGCIYIWTLGHDKTAHVVAREFGHEDVFRFLMERTPPGLELAIACELGDEPAFRRLLDARPDLAHTLTDAERRKVSDAARANNTDAVRLMLAAGWPVDARGDLGGTALHYAAWAGNVAMTREVLRHGPTLELPDTAYGSTPMGWAFHGSLNTWHKGGDHAAVVEVLLDAGAQPPPADREGTAAVREVVRRRRAS
jgi:ankyrin repeat protein